MRLIVGQDKMLNGSTYLAILLSRRQLYVRKISISPVFRSDGCHPRRPGRIALDLSEHQSTRLELLLHHLGRQVSSLKNTFEQIGGEQEEYVLDALHCIGLPPRHKTHNGETAPLKQRRRRNSTESNAFKSEEVFINKNNARSTSQHVLAE